MQQDFTWLTTKQVASQLKVTPAKVRRLINQGALQAVKDKPQRTHSEWVIKTTWLNAFIEARIEAIRKKAGK